jgi:hypothetical protein
MSTPLAAPRFAAPADSRPESGGRRIATVVRFVVLELLLWSSVYGLYLLVRGVSVASPREATSNAATLIGLERTLRLFQEARVQSGLEELHGLLSVYYMLGFAPLIVGVLLWLALRHTHRYRELRSLLLVSVGLALVIHLAYPVAPPRLIPELGITDTVGLDAREASFAGVRFNPYAAVPSMHVGWNLLVAVIGFRTARPLFVRALFAGHPAVMTVAVTATGNHFFLDSLAGAAVALGVITVGSLARSVQRVQAKPTTQKRPLRHVSGHRRRGANPALRVSHTFEVSHWPPARFRAARLVPPRAQTQAFTRARRSRRQRGNST